MPRILFPDPIFGHIFFEGIMAELIETAEMTRLRYVKQLATLYLFYVKAIHTRYDHSCGMAHLVKGFFDYLPTDILSSIGFEERSITTMAALVHDTGQPAWSHSGELFTKFRGFGDQFKHERVTAELIRNGKKFDKYFNHWGRPRIYEVINDQEKLDLIADVVEGRVPIPRDVPEKDELERRKRFLGQLVSSYCDFDRVEYLLRDSFFMGSLHTPFSLGLIYANIGIVPADGANQLGFLNSIFGQSFILTRELSYSIFYKDVRDLVAREMLARAWHRVFPKTMDVYELWFSTDEQLLSKLEGSGDKLAQRICSMIKSGRIYEIVADMSFRELDYNARQNLVTLDEDRVKLLKFEQEIADDLGLSSDDLVVGVHVHPTPVEVNANVLDGNEVHQLGEYTLMKSLYDPEYCRERSKLVVGVYHEVNRDLRSELKKTIIDRLKQFPGKIS